MMGVHPHVTIAMAAPMLVEITSWRNLQLALREELIRDENVNDLAVGSVEKLRKRPLPLDLILSLSAGIDGTFPNVLDLLPEAVLLGGWSLLHFSKLSLLGHNRMKHLLDHGCVAVCNYGGTCYKSLLCA